ncbi:MAG: hypothetical protein QOJ54_2222 [Aliidongia sp.]|jgi:hypothetical protein|nr:hypothetical protein [Aliidongia sp.]
MILYELKCPSGHVFEGWFRSSDLYEEQREAGEIACPVCGTSDVVKAPMAPRLVRSDRSPQPEPAEQMALLRGLRRAVETKCEDVGDRFAEEARKIHYGETDPHGIYGQTSESEAEALAEEGIAFGRIPWVPLADN